MKPLTALTGAQLSLSLLLGLASGCSAQAQDETPQNTDEPAFEQRLNELGRDLKQGTSGAEVRTLHEYLSRYGYLPNARLAREYPTWRPIIQQGPARLDTYDENTLAAVEQLQIRGALPVTGIVDEATRALLKVPRCAHPESLPADPSEKYALTDDDEVWLHRNLSWKLENTDDVSLLQARGAVSAALATWAAQTGLTFTEVSGTTAADIMLRFGVIDGPGKVAAQASPPLSPSVVIDTAESWSVATPTPATHFDLQTVLIHELGHKLGLLHAAAPAVMQPSSEKGVQRRVLNLDDKMGISVRYDAWQLTPGCAKEIGIGADGSVWVIGCLAQPGGFSVHKWGGTDWIHAPNSGAIAIAVDPTGKPWVVNNLGEIIRRTSNSPTSGSWQLLPGCANDIDIAIDGSVWVLGCNDETSGNGTTVNKWNGSNWTYVPSPGGNRIAVDGTGRPWIIDADGNVIRRTTSSPTSGSWVTLPTVNGLNIGTGPGNHTWIVGSEPTAGGFALQVWNEQPGGLDIPTRARWIDQPGGALLGVDLMPTGQPWVIINSGNIFRVVK
ncbi:MAG TPA: matrixin family metalloprotease [Polyangiaceae bacterium]|nr:matrixin family metalloprotease [Polyangiaceae bacterium]